MSRMVAPKQTGKGKDIESKTSQKDPKGWAEIQEGEPLTKLANMVVLGRLKKLGKDTGTTDQVNRLKVLTGTDKLAFCLAA